MPLDRNYDDLERDVLIRLLRLRDRQAETSAKFWVRAAKKALSGDPRELRLRVDMFEDTTDYKLVQSA